MIPSSRLFFVVAGLLAVVFPVGFKAWALEAVVRTTAGATHKGEVTWTAQGIAVRPSGGDAVVVPVDQLAEFAGVESPAPGSTPAAGARETNGVVVGAVAAGAQAAAAPAGWNTVAIGPGSGGKIVPDNGGLLVSGAGGGLRGNSDNFFLAEKRMNVSGQIVGALTAFGGTNAESMAGLTLRDNLGESAAYAFLGQRARSGVCFQYRQIAGGMTMRVTNAVMKFPAWFRLSRMGGSVVAEVSSDGRQWQAFGQANVNLGQNVRAGMAVCSGEDEVYVRAAFQEPTVGASGLGYVPASGYPRILLRGGSVLIAPVASADDSVVRLGGSFAGALVSMLNVARIEFVPTTPELEARLEPDRPGLVLTDGDFLEGSVRSVATNVVTLSSLLLGFRRFPVGSEAATLQVGELTPEEVPYRVRTRNGSELRARRIESVPSGLRVESPLLGALTLRAEEIASVRRGPAPQ